MKKIIAALAICVSLAGCSAINKACNSAGVGKTVGVLQADFGIVGNDISLGVGDLCSFAASATTTTTTAPSTTAPATTTPAPATTGN
jgi:hypothetical protein